MAQTKSRARRQHGRIRLDRALPRDRRWRTDRRPRARDGRGAARLTEAPLNVPGHAYPPSDRRPTRPLGFALWFIEPGETRIRGIDGEHEPVGVGLLGHNPLFWWGSRSLLRGRLQVRILSGTPENPVKYGVLSGVCRSRCRNARLIPRQIGRCGRDFCTIPAQVAARCSPAEALR